MRKTVGERIHYIKKMREEHDLSVAQIADIISENGEYVCERTIYSILADGSEEKTFQPHSVIAVYEALTVKYGDISLPDDVSTLRALIASRNRQIDSLLIQFEEREEEFKERLEAQTAEYDKREALFEERKANFERTIDLLKAQLVQANARLTEREAIIARKDAILEKLIDNYLEKKE